MIIDSPKPTPEYVVEKQFEAVSDEFDHTVELEEAIKDGDIDYAKICEENIAEAKQKHETPVNLSECRIVTKLAPVRLTKDAIEDLKHVFDDIDVRHNMFLLLGEASHAEGHICVVSASSGKVYTMLHSNNFEIIPTQEC